MGPPIAPGAPGQEQGAHRRLRADGRAGAGEEDPGKEIEIFIPPGPRLGQLVIEAQNVTKAYGDNLLLDRT